MIHTIRAMAKRARISEGTLLKFAREVAEDAAIASLHELTGAQAERLAAVLTPVRERNEERIIWWPEAA